MAIARPLLKGFVPPGSGLWGGVGTCGLVRNDYYLSSFFYLGNQGSRLGVLGFFHLTTRHQKPDGMGLFSVFPSEKMFLEIHKSKGLAS